MTEAGRIVSNTGPLISLEKLRQGYDFIRQLYDTRVKTRSRTALRCRLNRVASENRGRGLEVRPCATRSNSRRSITMVSNIPALSHRWLC